MDKLNNLVLDYTKLIPMGKVTTYAEIARAIGNDCTSHIVLKSLHNLNQEQIPSHRVVNSKGELSRKFAFGGIKSQKDLLINEGVQVKKYKVDLDKYGFYFW